jgi:hypothetical protein
MYFQVKFDNRRTRFRHTYMDGGMHNRSEISFHVVINYFDRKRRESRLCKQLHG